MARLAAALVLLGSITVASGIALSQISVPSAVRDALLAQVLGSGGCTDLDEIRSTTYRFFPTVQFFEGACRLQHEELVHPLVGRDSSGLIVVLDSRSGFQFLVAQHRPVGLDSATAVEYTRLALIMQGDLPPSAQLLTTRAQAPLELCRRAEINCGELRLTRATRGGRLVTITAFIDIAIYSASIRVDFQSGRIAGGVEMWTDKTVELH